MKNAGGNYFIGGIGGYSKLTQYTAPYQFIARIWAPQGASTHHILPFTQTVAPGSFVKIDYDGIGGYGYLPGQDRSYSQKRGTILLNSFGSERSCHLQREDVISKDIQLDIYVDNADPHKFYLDIYSKYNGGSAIYMYLTIHDVATLSLQNLIKLSELITSENPPENATKLDLLAF